MALGGVATGNMNAKLQLIVAGIIINSGSMFADNAVAAKIGNSNVAVAVLLVTSVKKVTTKQIARTMINTGTVSKTPNESPIDWLSPEAMNAFAIAIPPP